MCGQIVICQSIIPDNTYALGNSMSSSNTLLFAYNDGMHHFKNR